MVDKKSVIIYHDWLDVFESLPAEEAKSLIVSIIKYSQSDTEPETISPSLDIAWKFIGKTLKRDKEKYIGKCAKNAENGKKGGRPQKQTVSEKSEKSERFFEKAKKADNDSDSDNDNVNDNDYDYVNDSDSVCVKENTAAAEKSTHTYGKYNNIFLTEEEYRSFIRVHSSDGQTIIDQLSEKIALEPDKYKHNHAVWLDIFAKNYKPPKQKKPEEVYSPPSFDIEAVLKRSLELDPTQTKRRSPL